MTKSKNSSTESNVEQLEQPAQNVQQQTNLEFIKHGSVSITKKGGMLIKFPDGKATHINAGLLKYLFKKIGGANV